MAHPSRCEVIRGRKGRKSFINCSDVQLHSCSKIFFFLPVSAHLNRDCFKQVDLRGQDMRRRSLQFTGIQKLYEDFYMKSLLTVKELIFGAGGQLVFVLHCA